jgi:hypothetical protein
VDDSDLALQAALDWNEGTLRLAANGPLAGPVRFKTHGKTASVQGLAKRFMDLEAAGAAAFAMDGSIKNLPDVFHNVGAKPLTVLPNVEAKGWVETAIDEIDLPGVARGVSLTGRMDFGLDGDGVGLSTRKLVLAADSLDNAVNARLPEAVRPYITDPLGLTVRPHEGEAATVRFTLAESGGEIGVSGALKLKSGANEVSVRGPFEASVDSSGHLERVRTDRAALALSADMDGRGKAAATGAVTDLRYEGDTLAATFDVSATYDGIADERLAPLSASGRMSGRIAMDGDRLSATVAPGGTVSAKHMEFHDVAKTESPVTATLSAPLRASIDLAQGLPSIIYNARILISPGQLSAKNKKRWTNIVHSAIPIVATTQRLNVQTNTVELPDQELRIEGIELQLELGPTIRSTLTAETIEHQGTPAFVTPLRLTAALQADQSGRVTFEGRIFDPPERISVSLSGHHDASTNRGEIAVDASKLVFLPTVLQPRQLFPILGSTLREVDGTIDALAKFAWNDGETESSLELLIDAKLIKADEFKFEDTATVIRFDSLLPPSTPAAQEVNIGLLDVGVPMQNGRLEFQLDKEGNIRAALRE